MKTDLIHGVARTAVVALFFLLIGCGSNDRTMPGDAPPVLKRYCQTLDLKNDSALIAQYLMWHSPDSIWEEIPEGIREAGIEEMQIFLEGTRLCMIVETPTEFNWTTQMLKLGGLPRQAEWDSLMSTYQQAPPGAGAGNQWRLMERIFSLRNSRASDAGSGYPLAKLQSDAKRYCQTMELVNKPRLIEEFKKWHKRENIWTEITEGIKQVGILDMEIYLLGSRLYMIIDAPEDFDWDARMQKLSQLTRQAEWDKLLAKFKKTDPITSTRETWKLMKQIFQLSECP